MNLKTLRKIHLYLGCLFAPLIILFIVSGCLQTFQLHYTQKGSSERPSAIAQNLSSIHMFQGIRHKKSDRQKRGHPELFRILVLAMSLGLLITIILGVIMAFKYTQNALIVWGLLLTGILLPLLLLF